jgi:hypothetical protein
MDAQLGCKLMMVPFHDAWDDLGKQNPLDGLFSRSLETFWNI